MAMFRIALVLLVCAALSRAADRDALPQFAKDGQLARPAKYREWVFLSSGLSMTYPPQKEDTKSPNFENVFVPQASYRKFMETGTWPDKTMFVTEVRQSATKGSINVGGRFQTSLAGLEVSVKDTSRYQGPSEDGWGYFFFSATAQAAKRIGAEGGCNACHNKNAAVDNVFVQFYPTLLEIAKVKGTLKPSYVQAAGH